MAFLEKLICLLDDSDTIPCTKETALSKWKEQMTKFDTLFHLAFCLADGQEVYDWLGLTPAKRAIAINKGLKDGIGCSRHKNKK